MPVAYDHGRYWSVVFARTGSAFPNVFKRSVLFCVFAATAVVLHWFFPECIQGFGGTVLSPFQVIVAFMVGFRMNKSFGKYTRPPTRRSLKCTLARANSCGA